MYIMHNKCGNFGEGRALPPLLQGNFYVRRMYKYTVLRGLFYNPPRRRSRRRTRAHPRLPCARGAEIVHRLPKWKARTGGGLQKTPVGRKKSGSPLREPLFCGLRRNIFLFYSSFSAAAISPAAAAAAAREISLPVNILFVLMGLSFLRLPLYPKSFEKKPFFSGISPLSIDFTS